MAKVHRKNTTEASAKQKQENILKKNIKGDQEI
jgi:hypothetical protein